jgi:GNAT superfamily N-acetyltransferase
METDGTSLLVHDPHNMAVRRAFTNPGMRGNGVATLLLDAALRKAASLSIKSVSVDFETRNAPAMAFWTRHFTPFAFSVLRCVDGRLFKNA